MTMRIDVRRLAAWQWTVAIAVVVLAGFALVAWRWPWRPGRLGGLVSGTVAALLFINAGAYPFRRRWRARPLGTARRWLQVHVYGSVIGMLLVLVHTGFRWPAGLMGWALLVLSAWTTATGVLGALLQRLVPRQLSRLTVEAIYERIPALAEGLAREADALMTEASDVLARAYRVEIRPALGAPRPSLGWLTGATGVREAALRPFARLRPFLDGGDLERLNDLESVVQDKLDLDAQRSLQGVLRAWLILHVPPALALLGLLAAHVAAVWWH